MRLNWINVVIFLVVVAFWSWSARYILELSVFWQIISAMLLGAFFPLRPFKREE